MFRTNVLVSAGMVIIKLAAQHEAMMAPPLDDLSDGVYTYLCAYRAEWGRAALEEEIAQDLSLSQRQVALALTLLVNAGKVLPGSTRPKGDPVPPATA